MTDINPLPGLGQGRIDTSDDTRGATADPGGERRSFHAEGPRADWADRLDGDMKAVLDEVALLNPQAIETLTPEVARQQPTPADGAMRVLRERGLDSKAELGIATRDFDIPGPAGPLKSRLYAPETDKAEPKPLPVVVYFHGGGFVIADINVYDAGARAIAKFADCIVVSVGYRLAPENKFPAAHDDAFAAYTWVTQNAASFGGDPDRIAVAGESAGGNLALATAIAARDGGIKTPLWMGLVYPLAGNDLNTESYQEFATAKPLNKPMIEWFVGHYTNSAADTSDPRINLLGADLRGLPGATIINAEIDPLATDGERLERALKDAGVEAHRHLYKGVTHEFFGMGLVVKDAAVAEQTVAHGLKKAFGTAILPF